MEKQFSESRPSHGGRALVAVLEAAPSELSALLRTHAASPIAVPRVSEALYLELEEVRELIDALGAGKFELALFMSGDAVSALFECAEELGRRVELVVALRALTIACRGPKATAALRRFGLHAKPEAGALLTSGSLLRAVQELELRGKGVLRVNGERGDALAKYLHSQQANLRDISLQQRRSPNDTAEARALIGMIIARSIKALIVSCEVQFLHLHQVARGLDVARELVYALRKHVVVAAVGTSVRDILEAHGVRAHTMPAQPQMLVMALMHFLDSRANAERSVASAGPPSS